MTHPGAQSAVATAAVATAAAVPSSSSSPLSYSLDEGTFNDYHFSCFVAMESPVTVVPRFTLPQVDGLGGVYGPFAPNTPVDVPLWLALYLRQTDTCTIDSPPYLRIAFLRGVLEREQASDSSFEALPFGFFEIAKRLCESGNDRGPTALNRANGGGGSGGGGGRASDDIPHLAEVVRLVRQIRSVRQRKLKQSMGVFEAEGSTLFIPGIRLTHIISSELHFLRSSFAVVLQQTCKMEARRAQPMASLDRGGRTAAVMPRLPNAFVAGPAAAAATSLPTAATTARLSTVSGSSTDGGGGGASSGVAQSAFDGGSSSATSGVGGAGQQLPLPQGEERDLTQTETVTGTAVSAPLGQPPAKKRRTLRQT